MLQNESLIVSLSVSQWTGRKLDKKITDEVNTSHNASDDAGRYNKLLVAKEHTEAISKLAGQARTFHYDNTLPWGDNNERLLPTKNYFTYVQKMAELKAEFEQAISEFFANYDKVIADARVRLNGMFRESDYPTKGDISSKFGFRTTFMPVPNNDIRVGLVTGEVDKLKLAIESEINNRLADAVKDIWARIKTQVGHMRDKLADEKGIFRDSLFENLNDLVQLLPCLNVTNDINIAKVCNDLKGLMEDPAAVRNNAGLRATKADEADAILNKFSSFFN